MPPILEITGATRDYAVHSGGQAATLRALRGIDLAVEPGEVMAIVGESGCGKTTLSRLCLGIESPSSGTVSLGGQPIAGYHRTERARLVQPVFQDPYSSLNPRLSVGSIVAEPLVLRGVGAREAEDRARALLSRLMVPQRLWTLPPATFSGGEQQRVNIARGLIAGHPILLLDEPTASLDAENRDVVAELIVEARERGAAIVGIFHDEETRNKVATRRLELKPVLRAVA